MKKLITFILIGVAVEILLGSAMGAIERAYAEEYHTAFIVVDVDECCDILTLESASGYIYKWDGAEDYYLGDIVSAIMEDNDTICIKDDEIIEICYAGFVTDFMNSYFNYEFTY